MACCALTKSCSAELKKSRIPGKPLNYLQTPTCHIAIQRTTRPPQIYLFSGKETFFEKL